MSRPIFGICARLTLLICRSGAYLYAVEFPKTLKANGTANLVVETVQTHATYPWPAEASQKDGQSLKYEGDLFVLSPYDTVVQRTKIRYVLPSMAHVWHELNLAQALRSPQSTPIPNRR